jgi:hypothetical protein
MEQLLGQYLYFGLGLFFFVWWVAAWFARPDLRKHLILAGIAGLVLAPAQQYIALQDWYYPKFLFGYRPDFLGGLPWPPEDILFGIGVAGLSAVLYPLLMGKRLVAGVAAKIELWRQLAGVGAAMAVMCVPFWLGAHSFYTSAAACLYVAGWVAWLRRDLIVPMVVSSVTLTALALVYYLWALHINPLWLVQEWYLDQLSGLNIKGVPLEELGWYLFAGLAFGGALPCALGEGYRAVDERPILLADGAAGRKALTDRLVRRGAVARVPQGIPSRHRRRVQG